MEKNLKNAIEKVRAVTAILTPELLDAICKGADEGEEAFQTAKDCFFEDLEARQSGVKSASAQRDRRLQEIAQRKANLTDAIGVAYSEQQIEKAHELEMELEELACEEYGVREAAKHVQTVKVRGDLPLFADMRAAYEQKAVRGRAAYNDIFELLNELTKLEKVVDAFSEKAKNRSQRYMGHDKIAEDCMVEAAESIIGEMDLSGGTDGFTGREEAAKIAIVCHSSQDKDPAGKLKNTPAFKKWIELLKKLSEGGIDHE